MKNRNAIRLLFLANSISGIAQGISMIAIPWYISAQQNQTSFFGYGYALATFISIFWGVYAGSLVDKHDRRNVFIALNVFSFCVIGLMSLWGFMHGVLNNYCVVFVFAYTFLIYLLHYPCLYAFAQEISEQNNLGKVVSQIEIQGQLCSFAAGALATLLLEGGQIFPILGVTLHLPFYIKPWAMHKIFMVDATTYLLSAIIMLRISYTRIAHREIDNGSINERIKTGYNFLRKHPYLLFFGLGSAGLFMSVITLINQAIPLYVKRTLEEGGGVFASGEMYFAIGATLAGILGQSIFGKYNAVKTITYLALAGIGVYILMLWLPSKLHFYLALFIVGLCNACIRILRFSVFYKYIPNGLSGRVNGFVNIIFTFLRFLIISLLALPIFVSKYYLCFIFLIIVILAGIIVMRTKAKPLFQS